jgi:hypothetical protein
MGLLFIFLGIFVLYLSKNENDNIKKIFYIDLKKLNLFQDSTLLKAKGFKILSLFNKMVDFKIEKIDDEIVFFTEIKKTIPKNLYDSTKIYYALNSFLFLSYKGRDLKKIDLSELINNKKFKIVLFFYDNEKFEYFLDKELYQKIKFILETIIKIKEKKIENFDIFPILECREEMKCLKCFYNSSCKE